MAIALLHSQKQDGRHYSLESQEMELPGCCFCVGSDVLPRDRRGFNVERAGTVPGSSMVGERPEVALGEMAYKPSRDASHVVLMWLCLTLPGKPWRWLSPLGVLFFSASPRPSSAIEKWSQPS